MEISWRHEITWFQTAAADDLERVAAVSGKNDGVLVCSLSLTRPERLKLFGSLLLAHVLATRGSSSVPLHFLVWKIEQFIHQVWNNYFLPH